MSRNLLQLLNKFKVYCKNKNEGCEEILIYENLEKHENQCKECLLCKAQCHICLKIVEIEEIMGVSRFVEHECVNNQNVEFGRNANILDSLLGADRLNNSVQINPL